MFWMNIYNFVKLAKFEFEEYSFNIKQLSTLSNTLQFYETFVNTWRKSQICQKY